MKNLVMMTLLVGFQIMANAQKNYKLDVRSSKLQWKISTMGNHFGYLLFSKGMLNYAVNGKPLSGDFVMDMNSIRSTDGKKPEDIARVNKSIKEPDFFDVKKYPNAIMKVEKILPAGKQNYYKINGKLTIRGITKPIDFYATIKETAGMVNIFAETTIDRTEWNIHHKPKPKTSDFFKVIKDKMMENEINILLNLWLTKQ